MTFHEFKQSLTASLPPSSLNEHLKALWFDGKDDWENAHNIIQDISDSHAAWIHAYLHRKEGDIWNADYWYNKAGKKRPGLSLDEEWENIAKTLIAS